MLTLTMADTKITAHDSRNLFALGIGTAHGLAYRYLESLAGRCREQVVAVGQEAPLGRHGPTFGSIGGR